MPAERGGVLVTGAGGFIGGRAVEVLHHLGYDVRAGVRRWSSAARIGRFPIEIVQCDLADRGQLDAACDGVSAIVRRALPPDCRVCVNPTTDARTSWKSGGLSI